MIVLGADGCPGGWVVAEVAAEVAADVAAEGAPGSPVRWHSVADAEGLLALADRLGAALVAADVPVGLPETGPRACDVAAKKVLGGLSASSVFPAPVRGVLAAPTYAAARALSPSLSAQAYALVPRIRDVDDALRRRGPAVHDRFVECHPELSLRALTGRALARKRSAPGALQRLRALEREFGPLPDDPPREAALDDALDALACAWTARRWAAGASELLGGETDALGTPMRIVV